MKIDVILASHGRPNFLKRAVDSLLSQTRKPDRIFLCNDDGDRDVRSLAASMLRPCDVFISAPHLKGPAETRNIGIEMSDADWLCFLDDDDTFGQDYLSAADAHLRSCGSVIPFSSYDIVTETVEGQFVEAKTKDMSGYEPLRMALWDSIPVSAFFVPAQLRDIKFDPTLSIEDWDYKLALSTRFPYKHFSFSGSRYHKRPVVTRGSAVTAARMLEETRIIYDRYPAPTPEIAALRRRRLGKLERRVADA